MRDFNPTPKIWNEGIGRWGDEEKMLKHFLIIRQLVIGIYLVLACGRQGIWCLEFRVSRIQLGCDHRFIICKIALAAKSPDRLAPTIP
jgi:hypothetical protein